MYSRGSLAYFCFLSRGKKLEVDLRSGSEREWREMGRATVFLLVFTTHAEGAALHAAVIQRDPAENQHRHNLLQILFIALTPQDPSSSASTHKISIITMDAARRNDSDDNGSAASSAESDESDCPCAGSLRTPAVAPAVGNELGICDICGTTCPSRTPLFASHLSGVCGCPNAP